MFNQPTGSGFFPAKEKYGHLILFTVVHGIEKRPDNLRQGQLQDVAIVDYVDLDDPQQLLMERAMVGNVGIVNKLQAGKTNILGRIGQIDTGKGQPAWVLIGYDDSPGSQDVARATAWVTAYTSRQMQQPAAPQVPQVPQVPQPQVPQAPQVPQYPNQGQPQGYAQQPPPISYQQQAGVSPTPPQPSGAPDFAAIQALLGQAGINTQVAGHQPDQPQY